RPVGAGPRRLEDVGHPGAAGAARRVRRRAGSVSDRRAGEPGARMGFTRERVLITGASGFVGACLTRDLIAEGHDVHLLLRGASPNWRLAGLHGRYTAQHADLRDAPAVRAAVAAARPEVVYHVAAHGAFHGQGDRAAILASNVLGTANLLDALHGHDYRVLVH